MTQAVIVISFPNPEDSYALGEIVSRAKKPFTDMSDAKIYLAIEDAADNILAVFNTPKSDSNLVDHARRELERINNDVDFNEMVLNVMRAFATYGHSGGSASVAIPLINDLLQFKNLSPLTDDPYEWIHHEHEGDGGVWQSRRCSEAFSNDGGKTYYLLSEGGNESNPFPIHESVKYDLPPSLEAKE